MAQQEHRISDGEEEATFLSPGHQPNMTVPFLPEFDPTSQFGRIAENSSMSPYQLEDLNPLASSDGPMPLLSSPLQSDASTSFDSLPSLVASEVKQTPLRPELMLPLQKPELQPQINQVVKSSPFDLFPEAGLQMEMELPSNQSHHGIMNPLLRADQQITMDQFVGMNHLSSFQIDPDRNQIVIFTTESTQISRSNCGTFVINESQGENTDCSSDGVSSNHPTGKRIHTFEEEDRNWWEGSFSHSTKSTAFLQLHEIAS
ncbi:uncharacterized protein LOC110018502 isoform X2 [Phalaenopsis equestris]|uniref:uncharacterized protein LOC110018502 isoform X2 n=1 Tax=Phalaenopsis equestris TaxID=78828 RepID=UPI0009E3DB7F|nr:uncharacterized protein LOC110018502 isoform X2 [Phalaenopsis equestris]